MNSEHNIINLHTNEKCYACCRSLPRASSTHHGIYCNLDACRPTWEPQLLLVLLGTTFSERDAQPKQKISFWYRFFFLSIQKWRKILGRGFGAAANVSCSLLTICTNRQNSMNLKNSCDVQSEIKGSISHVQQGTVDNTQEHLQLPESSIEPVSRKNCFHDPIFNWHILVPDTANRFHTWSWRPFSLVMARTPKLERIHKNKLCVVYEAQECHLCKWKGNLNRVSTDVETPGHRRVRFSSNCHDPNLCQHFPRKTVKIRHTSVMYSSEREIIMAKMLCACRTMFWKRCTRCSDLGQTCGVILLVSSAWLFNRQHCIFRLQRRTVHIDPLVLSWRPNSTSTKLNLSREVLPTLEFHFKQCQAMSRYQVKILTSLLFGIWAHVKDLCGYESTCC